MEEKITLRPLLDSDLPSADDLRRAAGWNQTLADWQRLLTHDPEGCFAAIDQDKVVGTATTISFGIDLAWIGMVLVDPSRRNRGIGRQLLTKCLDHLQEKKVRSIKLDATPAGQILYEKLGFRAEWPLIRWMKAGVAETSARSPSDTPHPFNDQDWTEIVQLDQQAFGVDRSSLLQAYAKDSHRSAVYRSHNGTLEGFGLGRTGILADYIGPVVARSEEAGVNIVQQLLRDASRPVFWDIPAPCEPATSLATPLGFTQQRSLIRMYLGENHAPGQPHQLWAISDPATG